MLYNPHEFVLPGRGAVTTVVRKVTDTLAAVGVPVVCCGGAARDAYHFVPPKDFDFIILQDPNHPEPLGEPLLKIAVALVQDTEFGVIHLMQNYAEGNLQLNWIIKAKYKGHTIDIISPRAHCYTAEDAVRTLDLTVNAAWIDVSTYDTLCITLAGVYPSVSDDFPVRLMSPKSCTAERVDYIRSKYPQYRYDISAEELLPPKTEGVL